MYYTKTHVCIVGVCTQVYKGLVAISATEAAQIEGDLERVFQTRLDLLIEVSLDCPVDLVLLTSDTSPSSLGRRHLLSEKAGSLVVDLGDDTAEEDVNKAKRVVLETNALEASIVIGSITYSVSRVPAVPP